MRTALLLLLVLAGCGHPQPVPGPAPVDAPEIIRSLFLIGDAGGPVDHDQVLRALEREITPIRGRSFVMFLGDNVYPRGMPQADQPTAAEARQRLARQVAVLTASGTRGVFVPGNHDWERSGIGGFQAIVRQDNVITELGKGLVELLPHAGCPGPVVRDEGPFRIVILDSEWLLRDPTMARGGPACSADSDSLVLLQVDKALSEAGGRQVVLAAHHPLQSGGVHGGHFTWVDHIFPLTNLKSWAWLPLPIIGSIYPLTRGNGASAQDLGHERNRVLRERLEAVLRRYQPMAYASGHEHGLQVLAGSSARWLLVTGAGYYGHTGHISWLDSTRYEAQESGYMRLDATTGGRVRLGVVVVDGQAVARETYSVWLH